MVLLDLRRAMRPRGISTLHADRHGPEIIDDFSLRDFFWSEFFRPVAGKVPTVGERTDANSRENTLLPRWLAPCFCDSALMACIAAVQRLVAEKASPMTIAFAPRLPLEKDASSTVRAAPVRKLPASREQASRRPFAFVPAWGLGSLVAFATIVVAALGYSRVQHESRTFGPRAWQKRPHR